MVEIKAPLFVQIAGRKLAYEEVSPAQPQATILLLTGLASKRQAWYNQLAEFGRYYRTIALDHRDVGDSDEVTAPYTIKDQADDAAALLKALAIPKAHIIGISMGGFISLELTLRHPALVNKLVLVSTSAGGLTNVPASPKLWPTFFLPRRSNPDVGAQARKIYSRIMGPGYGIQHPDIMEEIAQIARYRPMSAEAFRRQFRAVLSHDVVKRLEQIHVPTLVIHGDRDPLVPLANGRKLARRIAGAKMIIYSGVGHIPIIEQATEFNRDVLAFLANPR
jgi:pimeloyl-ACP methyl ester carboxylesterase